MHADTEKNELDVVTATDLAQHSRTETRVVLLHGLPKEKRNSLRLSIITVVSQKVIRGLLLFS